MGLAGAKKPGGKFGRAGLAQPPCENTNQEEAQPPAQKARGLFFVPDLAGQLVLLFWPSLTQQPVFFEVLERCAVALVRLEDPAEHPVKDAEDVQQDGQPFLG